MAYLNSPFTIIDNQSDSNNSLESIVKNYLNDFSPPAATWFDEDRQHFVALKARASSIGTCRGETASASISLDSSLLAYALHDGRNAAEDENNSEVVQYQAFCFPERCGFNSKQQENDDAETSSYFGKSSVFDAAKKAAQNIRQTLVCEISVAFQLPLQLANVESPLASNDDDLSGPKIALHRRIPILAKFSEKLKGVRFIALQYTPTMIRIAAVEQNMETRGNNKHWSIELSNDVNPVISAPGQLPSFQGRTTSGKSYSGLNGGEIMIIGGGVIWCKRGSNSHNLIIVTNIAVLVYNMDVSKRQFMKSQLIPHQSAATFWFESITRTLVVGSYKSLPEDANDDGTFPLAVMEMKTFFFSSDSAIETLPIFAVGTLREEFVDTDDVAHISPHADKYGKIVLPSDISLISLHGDVFCVELGSLGGGKGIGLIKLDREARCITVKQHKSDWLIGRDIQPESTFVGVVDNLLCIFLREKKSTLFLDVWAMFSDDNRIFREIIKTSDSVIENGVWIHDESLSFLPPSFFLNTDGQGLIYEVKLDLDKLLNSIPWTACIILFLLKRNAPREKLCAYIIDRITVLIEMEDFSTLRLWLSVLVDQYSKSEVTQLKDFESTQSLLSLYSLFDMDTSTSVDENVKPEIYDQVLSQAEIIQLVLLKHVKIGLEERDSKKLKFMCSLSIHYLIEIERRHLHSCFALQSLVIFLLWESSENEQLSSFLSARESQWTITRRKRQMNIASSAGMYFDFPGVKSFAEILFLIVTHDTVGKCFPSTKQKVISHATTILIGCDASAIAAKHLLSVGLLSDAIGVCSKRIRNQKGVEELSMDKCATAVDFFHASVESVKLLNSIGDRCKTFYHLYFFLQKWDPSAFLIESRKVNVARHPSIEDCRRRASFGVADCDSVIVEKSRLAHIYPKFPDDLFGGTSSSNCRKLRILFGYDPIS